MQVIEGVVADRLARPEATWQVHIAGTLDVLPDATARALKEAVEATRERATGAHVTLAIGYGGRQEVVVPGTCTRPGSPTPTWSSVPAVSSAYPTSCSGRPCSPSCTSATPTGPRSVRSTSCGRYQLRR